MFRWVSYLQSIFKALGLLVLALLMPSCGKTPGMEKLQEFCDKDAGVTFTAVEPIRSLYIDSDDGNGRSWTDIPLYDYDFIEVSLDDEEISGHWLKVIHKSTVFPELDGQLVKLYDEPGFWRISRQLRTDGNCNPYLEQ